MKIGKTEVTVSCYRDWGFQKSVGHFRQWQYRPGWRKFYILWWAVEFYTPKG